MTASTVKAVCVVCDESFTIKRATGRRRITCSDKCRKIRETKNKRVQRTRAKGGGEQSPYNYRRPNVGDTNNYKAMTQADLADYIGQSEDIWDRRKLRQGSTDISGWTQRQSDFDGEYITPDDEWIPRVSPSVAGMSFVTDDYFDPHRNELGHIDKARRPQVDQYLKKHRFTTGWDVGRTLKEYLPVIGSDRPVAQATPHHLRTHFSCSERPTGALKPFVWKTETSQRPLASALTHPIGVPIAA